MGSIGRRSGALERQLKVLAVIRENLAGCDLKLSLFAASLHYMYESNCVPFPPQFVVNGQKLITELRAFIEAIPDLPAILANELLTLTEAMVDFLYWLLCDLHGPQLQEVPEREHPTILAKTNQEQAGPAPTRIFRVVYRTGSTSEARFQMHAAEFPTSYAFHGTKIQNMHNILHHNLQQHLNKNSLFGEGLYLSTELNVSLPYSPNGTGWSRSTIGSTLGCVALCEYVEHPVSVRKCTKEAKRRTDIPEKYIVVRNNDIVRVRYLVLYASGVRGNKKPFGTLSRFFNVKLLFLYYFLVLVAIGCSDSRYMVYLKKKLYRMLSTGYQELKLLFGGT